MYQELGVILLLTFLAFLAMKTSNACLNFLVKYPDSTGEIVCYAYLSSFICSVLGLFCSVVAIGKALTLAGIVDLSGIFERILDF